MPGTFGTLVGVVLYWAAEKFLAAIPLMGFICLFIFFAIFISHLYEGIHEGHDHSEVVIDEVAGFLVSMMWLPATPKTFLAAFLLFRIFCTAKFVS